MRLQVLDRFSDMIVRGATLTRLKYCSSIAPCPAPPKPSPGASISCSAACSLQPPLATPLHSQVMHPNKLSVSPLKHSNSQLVHVLPPQQGEPHSLLTTPHHTRMMFCSHFSSSAILLSFRLETSTFSLHPQSLLGSHQTSHRSLRVTCLTLAPLIPSRLHPSHILFCAYNPRCCPTLLDIAI